MRNLLITVLLLSRASAQSPSISPNQPTATVGSSITLTSSTPVKWSLNGVGALSNETSTSVTYSTPAHIASNTNVQGCAVLPNDAIFNTSIVTLPVHTLSSTWLAPGNASSAPITFTSSWGFTTADSNTPRVSITPYYGDGLGNSVTYSTPVPDRASIHRENGSWSSGYYTQADHHVLTVDHSSCTFYEYYNDLVGLGVNEESLTEACRNSGDNCNASSEIAPYTSTSVAVPSGSTDAAGLPLAPLTWSLSDIMQGPTHAVRFTSSIGYINSLIALWPATSANGANPNAAAYGSRWRLRTAAQGGPNVPLVCGDNIPCAQIIKGLCEYGMMLADIGLGNNIQIADDAMSDPNVREGLRRISAANIGITQFDIIDESSLQETAARGYQVPGTGSYLVTPLNNYVTPQSSALIKATSDTGVAVSVSVALQGIGVGIPSPTMAIAAGTPAYQLPSWVTPASADQRVTWALVSGAGSVTPDGWYTAPPNVTGLTQAVLEATPVADPNVHTYLYTNVLTNNNGTYSIDINASTQTTSPGKVWNTDFGIQASDANFDELLTDYPNWVDAKTESVIPEYLQYQSVGFTYGGDIHYTAVIPNGNYKVRVMQGQPWNGTRPPATLPQDMTKAPTNIDINGVTVAHLYDWAAAVAYAYATPVDIYVPATVTDNNLSLAIRQVSTDNEITPESGLGPLYKWLFPHFVNLEQPSKAILASALEIIPDSETAHWAIDSQGVNTIKPGENIQLYVVDWHTGKNDPTWSLLNGPQGASISQTGLLSLSASASSIGQPIAVRAADSQYSAQVTFSLPVTQQAPLVSWPTPTAISYGAQLGPQQLNASSNVSGTFSYNPAAGTVLHAGGQLLSVKFTPSDPMYSPVSASVQLTVTKSVPMISWTPEPITPGTPLSAIQLCANANTAGTFTYDPPLGTVLPEGVSTVTATFEPADSADYQNASLTAKINASLRVIRRPPQLTWKQVTVGSLPSNTLVSASNEQTSFILHPSNYAFDGSTDSLSMLARTLGGNNKFIARVTLPDEATPDMKGSIVLRASASPTAAFVSFGIGKGQVTFSWRPFDRGFVGGYSFPTSIKTPVWLMLYKKDNDVWAWFSSDGEAWKYGGVIGSFFDSTTYLFGLESSANSITAPSIQFDDVSSKAIN